MVDVVVLQLYQLSVAQADRSALGPEVDDCALLFFLHSWDEPAERKMRLCYGDCTIVVAISFTPASVIHHIWLGSPDKVTRPPRLEYTRDYRRNEREVEWSTIDGLQLLNN